MRHAVLALLMIAFAMTSGSAQEGRGLVGTYTLLSITRTDGTGRTLTLPGERPSGYLFYDRTGLMAAVIQQSGRSRFAAAQPTPQEAVAAVTSYSAYFGTFATNEAERTVTHYKHGSFDPNETGSVDRHSFTATSGQLVLQGPPAADGVRVTSTWERMPELSSLTPMHRTFIGFRKLVSNEVRNAKGEILPGPAGGLATGGTAANPGQSGYIVYSAAGVMAVQMMQPKRLKYTGARPSGDEALAIFQTYNSYFGPYFFSERGDVVVHQRAGSFNPNTIADVPRTFTLDGPRVTLLPPPAVEDGVVQRQGYLTWELVSLSESR